MNQFHKLAEQLDKEYQAQLDDLNAERDELSKQRKALATKSANLNKKEEEMRASEVDIAKRLQEVEDKFSKIRRDEDVASQYEEVLKLDEANRKAKKEILDLIAEKDLRIEQIHKAERALSDEKATYKEKIRAEIQEELKKLIK